MSVIDEIAAERRRQIEQEGWTLEHDNRHEKGEMAVAAACYTLGTVGWDDETLMTWWPWAQNWFKPKGPRRDLIRAAALIVAEIERLDRLSHQSEREVA